VSTLLAVSLATANASLRFTPSCESLEAFPGGCDPENVVGACYSSLEGVSWACGVPDGSVCPTVPLPPGQPRPANLRYYEGYCRFSGETQTSSTQTQTSSTQTTVTTTVTQTFTSTTTVTRTTTLPFAPEGSPVAMNGHLRVEGTQIVNEHNESVRLRGMSLFWSQWGAAYWNEDALGWLRRDWGIELIRAAMGVEAGGYLDRPEEEMRKLKRVVYAAHALGIYVIVDWHDHHANQHLPEAKAFFREIARSYGHLPNVLFETFNEPTWQSWSREVKPYHEEVLGVIREYSENIVVCGTPTWSQDVDVASTDFVQGDNIVYTLHFYAGTHGQYLRDKAQAALDRGIALFVSEWGTCEADGNGGLDLEEAQAWMEFLEANNISDADWAVNDKKESCSALQPGAATNGHWGPRDLTPSGRWVRHSLRQHAARNGNPLIRIRPRNSTNETGNETGGDDEDEEDPDPIHLDSGRGLYESSEGAMTRCGVLAMLVLGLCIFL